MAIDTKALGRQKDETFLHYYSLLLGISQSVVLAFFAEHVRKLFAEYVAKFQTGFFVSQSDFQLLFNTCHSFLIIVGVFYSYYWYTLFYRHIIRFTDVFIPILVAVSELFLIFTLQYRSYYLSLAGFYAVITGALYFVSKYQTSIVFGDDETTKEKVLDRFKFHFRFSMGVSIAGVVAGIVVFICVSSSADPAWFRHAPLTQILDRGIGWSLLLAALLIAFFVQEQRFVPQVFNLCEFEEGSHQTFKKSSKLSN